MVGHIFIVGGIVVVVGLAAVAGLIVLGWRAKSPLVLRPVIALTRTVINPRQLRTAGRPGATASVIRHRGRKSGKTYETPLDAVPAGEGFLIALVYGGRTNWLRNVLASGSATIVREGTEYAVSRPKLVRMSDVAAHFAPADRRGFRILGIDECLRLETTEAQPAVSPDAQTVAAIRA